MAKDKAKKKAREEKVLIADVRVAVGLMIPEGGRWAGARVRSGMGNPYISVQYAGREYSDPPPSIYHLTPECFETLKKEGYIQGKLEPGYVSTHEFLLSRHGSEQWRAWEHKDEADAKALLIPGTHGWSSQYAYHGKHRLMKGSNPSTWAQGWVFSNPAGDYFMVFLEKKRVRKVTARECGLSA